MTKRALIVYCTEKFIRESLHLPDTMEIAAIERESPFDRNAADYKLLLRGEDERLPEIREGDFTPIGTLVMHYGADGKVELEKISW